MDENLSRPGHVIYVPLASIPYLGFFIGLLITLLGLGAIWLSRKQVPQFVENGSKFISA